MSEWITDRVPYQAEGTNEGDVWVYLEDADEYVIRNQSQIHIGDPWREIDPPPLYVKAKRYVIQWDGIVGCWQIKDMRRSGVWTHINWLTNKDEHREAAERIAAIYEEEMP